MRARRALSILARRMCRACFPIAPILIRSTSTFSALVTRGARHPTPGNDVATRRIAADDQGMTAEASAMPPRRYYFRLDGSRLAEISGVDYTAVIWINCVAGLCRFRRWTYDEVLRKKRPLAYRRHGNIDEHPLTRNIILRWVRAGRIEKLLVAVIPGQVGRLWIQSLMTLLFLSRPSTNGLHPGVCLAWDLGSTDNNPL